MLKRLFISVLAIALLAGTTSQLMPHGAMIAAAKAAAPCVAMDMSTVSSSPSAMSDDMPCKGMIPVCTDSIGCAVVVDLPMPPQTAPAPVRWVQIVWSAEQTALAGRSVSPELFPPILSA
jgi:hypothetical protein